MGGRGLSFTGTNPRSQCAHAKHPSSCFAWPLQSCSCTTGSPPFTGWHPELHQGRPRAFATPPSYVGTSTSFGIGGPYSPLARSGLSQNKRKTSLSLEWDYSSNSFYFTLRLSSCTLSSTPWAPLAAAGDQPDNKSTAQHLKAKVRPDLTVGTSHFKRKRLQKPPGTRSSAWAKVTPKAFLMTGGFWPRRGAGDQMPDLP
uniref:Uncharacterized protein n=1 Tax=Molossus molossus TaxID=27622 RepID=A0A7J8DU20_MOLMO|nr:hypothetical protein HJG59_009169 [Molossus molossus]